MDEPRCPDGLRQACTRVEAVMSQLAFCSSITADRAATRIVTSNGAASNQLGAARSRRGKTTSAHTIASRMTDERTTTSKGAAKPVRMAFALR